MNIGFNIPIPTHYLRKNLPGHPGKIFGDLEPHTLYTFSGRSAIALYLNYWRSIGVLEDKNAQFLIPEWLCISLVMTMHNYCFPTTVMNKKVRGMLVYHQWGFPQKMEEILRFARKHKLFVIEDCANTFTGSYKGKRLGTFADSLWTFPKFFPSVAGGALYSKNTQLMQFAKKSYRYSDEKLEDKVFHNIIRVKRNPNTKNMTEFVRDNGIHHQLYRCPPYALKVVEKELDNGALRKRKENFDMLRDAFWGKAEEALTADSEVYPWIVPLFFGQKNERVAQALKRSGVESGVYHFDVNRNMLKPNYKECVAVPCHQGITEKQMQNIIAIIRNAL